MTNEEINKILEYLESKHRDCISFSKKHKARGNEDLVQYYEGATWALDYAIKAMKENIKT